MTDNSNELELDFLYKQLDEYRQIELNARRQIERYEREKEWAEIGIREVRVLIEGLQSRS